MPTVSVKHERIMHCFGHTQLHKAPIKTDNRSSIIAAAKWRQPISGVAPVQSTSPPGMTSVAGNQSCNLSGQKFSDETLDMHIQEPQSPLHMSTVNEDKHQEFTE